MAAEPGPEFRWGLVVRRSKYNRSRNVDGQLELIERSTRRQELVLTNHIKQYDMGRIVGVYKDIASAHDERAKRPEFENALRDLRAGRIDGIAAWRPDRLVRRVTQFRRLMLDLEESGGRLLFLKPMVIDTADTENLTFTRIFLDFLVAFAQMESEGMADRMVLMHEDRARQGLPPINSSTRTPYLHPFGHTFDWSALIPEEVELINEAVRRVLTGESTFAISRDWRGRGVKTPTGKPWQFDALKRVLTNARMVGKREYGGTLLDLEDVPPILDMETWERVREALVTRKPRIGRRETYQLTNIGVCGLCDKPLVGGSDSRSKRPTYVCRKRPKEPNACGRVNATLSYVDDLVAEQVSEFLNDRPCVLKLLRQHAKGAELEALHARQEELNESLVVLDSALNPSPGKSRMPLDRYWAQVEDIEDERALIQRKLAVTREAALLTETLNVEWTPELWAEQTLEWRRSILRLVTERIELHRPTKAARPGLYGTEFDPERVKIKFAA